MDSREHRLVYAAGLEAAKQSVNWGVASLVAMIDTLNTHLRARPKSCEARFIRQAPLERTQRSMGQQQLSKRLGRSRRPGRSTHSAKLRDIL